jgi:hypothetical protein
MQEKPLKTQHHLLYQKLKSKISYFQPVVKNDWIIKFSVLKETDILLIVVSRHTGQTIIRYFSDEQDAVDFINVMISKSAFDYQV